MGVVGTLLLVLPMALLAVALLVVRRREAIRGVVREPPKG